VSLSLPILQGCEPYIKAFEGIPGVHQKENAALAISLAESFVEFKQPNTWSIPRAGGLPQAVIDGLSSVNWPGRCQKVSDPEDNSLTWFLDGAHTEESLQCCLEWFVSPEASLHSVSR
jgi:folylpolyglutamate synthase